MKNFKKIFNLNKLSTLLLYTSILTFIIAFNFAHNPPSGWYQQFISNLNGGSIRDITFTDSLNGYIVTSIGGSNSYILKTTDGGNNWITKFLNTDPFVKVKFINDSIGFTNAFQTIFKTTNAGENWTGISLPGDLIGEDMYVLSEDTIWLVNGNSLVGGVFRTTNGGQSWSQQLSSGAQNPDRIYMFNQDIGFINNVSGNPILRKTTNGGVSWFAVSTERWVDMFFTDSLTGWKAYGNAGVQKTTDGGLSWQNQPLPHGGSILFSVITEFGKVNMDTIWGVGGTYFYGAGRFRGMIYRTTNGGNNWYYQIPDTSIHIEGYVFMEFSNEKIGWAYTKNPYNNKVFLPIGVHTVTGGDSSFVTNIKNNNNVIPNNYFLFQNYPNPFNPNTVISYELQVASYINIKVYDILGNEVKSLINKKMNSGNYKVEFDGNSLPSGIYFYTLIANGNRIDTKKMILIR